MDQTEIIQLKNPVTKKMSLNSFNTRMKMAGDRISELEDRSMKYTQAQQQKESRLNK